MFDLILTGVSSCLTSPLDWFMDLSNSLGFLPFFLGTFTVICVSRLLLKPLLGSGSSDKAKKREEE